LYFVIHVGKRLAFRGEFVNIYFDLKMVGQVGLEPSRPKAAPFKDAVSTNSTMPPFCIGLPTLYLVRLIGLEPMTQPL